MSLRTIAVAGLAASVLLTSTGCRVERTSGQRTQARAIEAVLQAEGDRLRADLAQVAGEEAQDYERLIEMYADLTDALLRSATGRPRFVQTAEDDLARLAAEARQLRAYRELDEATRENFEATYDGSRLRPWQQWRGRRTVREIETGG